MTAERSALGRLLIVDDEIFMMNALCDTLAGQGYEVAGYPAGKEALEALEAGEFDLLLTDLMMPGMDGITLLRAALTLDPTLMGIVMTGQGTVETAVEAMKIGAFDFVLKPVKLGLLLPTLARAMDVRRLRLENLELRETTAIYQLSMAVSHSLDLNSTLHKVADAAVAQCKADQASIMLTTPGDTDLYVAVTRGVDGDHLLGSRVPLGQGVAGWVAQHGEPLLLHGGIRDPRLTPLRSRPDIRSSISVPLMTAGKIEGVLNVNAIRRRPFTLGDLKAMKILAAIAASALQNARLYQEILRHASTLEARVQERTQELEAANLQLAAASRHKSEFLANMSHELRTPLNSILGFSELLREQVSGLLTEKHARFLSHISNSGKHLLQLISDILDIAKVEAGKFTLQPEPLPVAQTLEDILVIGRGLAHQKAQTVETDIAPDLPPLRADPVRFKQILFNLLSNAVKFTPAGGTVRVAARRVNWSKSQAVELSGPIDQLTTRPIDADGDYLEIRVSDTGAGIRAEDMPRLFREFVQLETTRAQQNEGTGLGLALTKRLVEMHGGRIWAESDGVGRGSTFTVHLPIREPEAADRIADVPLVLVVENVAPVRELLGEWLTGAGYRVEFAADGETAVAKAVALQPVAITLEVSLPGKDGFDVIADLKRDPATRNIPVLVVSAREGTELGFGLGLLDFLTKPVDRTELLERLNQFTLPGHATVLIVDDEPLIVRIVGDTLRRAGYQILEAESGLEGLAQAKARRPDLIILDLMMPDLSGFEVAQRLREAPETRGIPIIVYSGKELTAEERRGLEQQIQALVRKGRYSQEELVREVRHLEQFCVPRKGTNEFRQRPTTGPEGEA
jgi:signal transduction histidine kinase/DNA-binding response OmpR family regulator